MYAFMCLKNINSIYFFTEKKQIFYKFVNSEAQI